MISVKSKVKNKLGLTDSEYEELFGNRGSLDMEAQAEYSSLKEEIMKVREEMARVKLEVYRMGFILGGFLALLMTVYKFFK
jgi:hypothetical protein